MCTAFNPYAASVAFPYIALCCTSCIVLHAFCIHRHWHFTMFACVACHSGWKLGISDKKWQQLQMPNFLKNGTRVSSANWCEAVQKLLGSVTDLSSLKHSTWNSRIWGPSHALTLAALNLTHLWAVTLFPHWSANTLYIWNFYFLAEESNPKSLPTNAIPRLTMPQKCFGVRALLPRRHGPHKKGEYSVPQTS